MTDREQFEAWARSVGWPHYATMPVTKGPDFFSDLSWDVWQAARAQGSTPNPVEVGTTVQAGQMLSDDEIALVVADCSASAHRQDDFSFARAIEQTVLAKRVPTKLGWMCLTDFRHELGEAAGGVTIYPDLEDLKANRPCWEQCGVIQVGIVGEKGGA